MAKRIYSEGNFVKVDNDGTITRYPSNSYYRDENGSLTIHHPRGFEKAIADPTEWLNAKDGGVAYTRDTLEAFLDVSIGGFSSASGGSGAELQYIEVPISQVDMGKLYDGTGIDVLPAPGVGKYYDAEKMLFEYKFNTLPYNASGVAYFLTFCGINIDLQSNMWTNASRSTIARAIGGESSNGTVFPSTFQGEENKAVRFQPEEPGNAINNGDGSGIIKLWYRIVEIS